MKASVMSELPAALILCSLFLSGAGAALGLYLIRRAVDPRSTFIRICVISIAITVVVLGIAGLISLKIGGLVLQVAALLLIPPLIMVAIGCIAGLLFRQDKRLAAAGIVVLVFIMNIPAYASAYRALKQVVNIAETLGGTASSSGAAKHTTGSCPHNLRALWAAFNLYSQDWDALPPVANWGSNHDLISRVPHNRELHCPAVSNGHDNNYGYAYNSAIAGKSLGSSASLADMKGAAHIPLLYDSSNLKSGASDAFTSLPVPGRHNGQDYVLYLNGRVAEVTPQKGGSK